MRTGLHRLVGGDGARTAWGGQLSQARRLDQVSGDLAEVVELMTGEKPGTYAIEIETDYPGAAGAAAREALSSSAMTDAVARHLRSALGRNPGPTLTS